MKLNDHMRTIRKGLGISQRVMAERLGTNRNIYADYELGRTRLPADVYVKALALAATKPDKAAYKQADGRSAQTDHASAR